LSANVIRDCEVGFNISKRTKERLRERGIKGGGLD
jgi:hypothetical protein